MRVVPECVTVLGKGLMIAMTAYEYQYIEAYMSHSL
jgi:hypothetical protein